MNKVQIKQFNSKLNELENFINNKPIFNSGALVRGIRKIVGVKIEDKRFEESEIFDWIAECSSFFSEIGVSYVIIDNFLNFFKFSTENTEDGLEKRIGPFVAVGWNNKIYNLSGIFNFSYTKIAFRCAQSNLDKIVEEERIVPIWLTKELSLNDGTKNMSSSLELVESCYQSRDRNGVIINVNNLLDSILNLDDDLKKEGKNSIGKKLSLLSDDKNKLEKFGVSKDVVLALNGFRLIRNKQVAHRDSPLKYDIPFIVAVSFVYLVIFFLECFILNSEIFKKR